MARKTETSNRTRVIRERKTGHSAKVTLPTKKRSRRESISAPGIPPVMVRSAVLDSQATINRMRKKNKAKKVRRRYDVALNAPGAEMRLPALPQVRIGWRLVSAMLVALLGYAIYFVWNSPMYRVGEVEVQGVKRITNQDVNQVLDVYNEPIFTLNARAMQSLVERSFPEFSVVQVQVDLPDTVLVTVAERIPVLVWSHAGHTELVDDQGVGFPVRSTVISGEELASLPVVEADALPFGVSEQEMRLDAPVATTGEAHQLMSPEMVQQMLSITKYAPSGTRVVYDAEHGLGWKEPRGWAAYFGQVQDIDMKVSVYQAIVSRLEAEEIQPELISVEFVHAPYYRVAN
jgi:hypothetical protein